MRSLKISAVALGAMALSLSLSAMPAAAGFVPIDTNSDLGVDVSQVPLDSPDVNAFMASLAPDARAIIADTCLNYVSNPGNDIRSEDTIPFCQVVAAGANGSAPTVVGGGSVRSFATTSPLLVTPRAVGAPGGHSYNVFPSENDPNYGTDAQ
jgi:hypothetical protein